MNDKKTISNTHELQKYFATALRKRSKGETSDVSLDPSILKFFTRKDLIAILNTKYDGKLPKDIDLIELENEDLLKLIEDDLFILSFLIPKWISQELETQQNASNDASPAQVGASSANSSASFKPEDKTGKDKKTNTTRDGKKDDKKGGKGVNNAN